MIGHADTSDDAARVIAERWEPRAPRSTGVLIDEDEDANEASEAPVAV